MEQRQITGLTSRPELNGAVVEILGRDASTGRLRVRIVEAEGLATRPDGPHAPPYPG